MVVTMSGPAGMTLHMAARVGNLAALRSFVASGADVDAREARVDGHAADGATALHKAVEYGHVEAVRVLAVELGADRDAKNATGGTPLHYAAAKANEEMICVLEALGADMEARDAAGWVERTGSLGVVGSTAPWVKGRTSAAAPWRPSYSDSRRL